MAIPGLTNTQQASGVQLGGAITPQTVNAAQQQAQSAQNAGIQDAQLGLQAIQQSGQQAGQYFDRIGRTAGFMAEAGANLAKSIEQNQIQNQAAILAPLKAMTTQFGYKKIAAGDFSGFNDISAASAIGAGNPLLARMDAQSTSLANRLASDYVNQTIAAQRAQALDERTKLELRGKFALEDYKNANIQKNNENNFNMFQEAAQQDASANGTQTPSQVTAREPTASDSSLTGPVYPSSVNADAPTGSLSDLNNGAQQDAVDSLPQESATDVQPAAPVQDDGSIEVAEGKTVAPATAVGSTGDDSIDKVLLKEGVNLAKLTPEQRKTLTSNISKTIQQLTTAPVQLDDSEEALFGLAQWDNTEKLTKQLESVPLTTAARLLGAKAKRDPAFAPQVAPMLKELGVDVPSGQVGAMARIGKYEAAAEQTYKSPSEAKDAMQNNGLNPLPMDNDQAEIFGGNIGFISPKKKGTPVQIVKSLSMSNGKVSFNQKQIPGKPASESAGLPTFIMEPSSKILEYTNQIKNNPVVADQIKKAGGLLGKKQEDGSFRPTVFASSEDGQTYSLKTLDANGQLTEGTPISKDTADAVSGAQSEYQKLITTPSVKAYVFQIKNPTPRVKEVAEGYTDVQRELAKKAGVPDSDAQAIFKKTGATDDFSTELQNKAESLVKEQRDKYKVMASKPNASGEIVTRFKKYNARYVATMETKRAALSRRIDSAVKNSQPYTPGNPITPAATRQTKVAPDTKEIDKMVAELNELDKEILAAKNG